MKVAGYSLASMRSKDGLEFLLDNAKVAGSVGDPAMAHLISRITLRDYVRIANEVASVVRTGSLLDWGCGYGQMSYLLQARGLEVTSYDYAIEQGRASLDHRIPLPKTFTPVIGHDPVKLPFPDASFNAVLSCGVLEHVEDEAGSLVEIRRVLKKGGTLNIYNLPQKHSYKEWVVRGFNLGYSHERTYTGQSARRLLEDSGFSVKRLRRGGFLPHMLSGLPKRLKAFYGVIAPPLYVLDRALSRLPGLDRISEAIEIIAKPVG